MANWHIQLHPNDLEGWNKIDIKNIVLETGYIGIGDWDEGENQITQFRNSIQISDYVIIRHKGPLGIVKVIGQFEEISKENVNWKLDWFPFRRKVEIIEWFDDEVKKEIGSSIDSIFQPTTLGISHNSIFINNWVNRAKRIMEESKKLEIKKILEYKKQIILQGPPGTGKTRLAKEIAGLFNMVNSTEIKSSIEKVNDFFESNKVPSYERINYRKEVENQINDFKDKYPVDNLEHLTLDEYCFGTGLNDSFCYLLEYKLIKTGKYSGEAGKFKIYWNKNAQLYSKSGFVKNIESDEEAMALIALQIKNVVAEIDLDEALKRLSGGYILKILNTYHQDKYFPISKEKCINNALKIFDVDFAHMNLFEKNLKLQEIFTQKKAEYQADITNYEFMYFLFDNFSLREDVFVVEEGVSNKISEVQIVQFHPSYSYEDFVRGIAAKPNDEKNGIFYEGENKIIGELARKAKDQPTKNFILIIDEINRANLSSVLGELIYALEYRYYFNGSDKDKSDSIVKSMYGVVYEDEGVEPNFDLALPENLYIIGTMNTADRSVGHIDYAIRRRFAFVDVPARKLADNEEIWFNTPAYLAVENLFNETNVSTEFEIKDIQIGHSYFIVKREDAKTDEEKDSLFRMKMKYEVVPILNEYVKDGILNPDTKNAIEKIRETYA